MREEGFGSRLKKLRKDKGITQIEIAKILKTSQAQISRYESGADQPADEAIAKIAKYFKVTKEYLTKVENKSVVSDGEGLAGESAETIGERIRIIRLYSRQSQTEFAKLLSISQSNLSAVEIGQQPPNVEAIKQLGLMGFDLKWILYGNSSVKEKSSEIAAEWELANIIKMLNPLSADKLKSVKQCLDIILTKFRE